MSHPPDPDQPRLDALASMLDLQEEFEVVDLQEDRKAKVRHFTLIPRVIVGICPDCGAACSERHACHDREVVDLPMGVFATRLGVRLFQFRCVSCDRYFTPRYAALAEGAHATERFLLRMAELLKHSDVSNAAAYLGVAAKTLDAWYYDYLQRLESDGHAAGHGDRRRDQLKPVTSLGIDELSLKKDINSSASC